MKVSRHDGQIENEEGPSARVYQSSYPITGLGLGQGGSEIGIAPMDTARPGIVGLDVLNGELGERGDSNGDRGDIFPKLGDSCGRTSELDEARRLCPCPGGLRLEGDCTLLGANERCLVFSCANSFVPCEKDF